MIDRTNPIRHIYKQEVESMDAVNTDKENYEYLGEFHYGDVTVHRYRRTDTTEEEKEEIIMGIKKVCLKYQLRKQKEAEEQKRKEQEEKADAGYHVGRGTEDTRREDTQESVGVSEV